VLAALRVEPSILLPGPGDVIGAFRDMFSSSSIWVDLRASGEELLYGFLLAAGVGILLGLAIGWYRRVGYIFDPFINFFYAVPRIALFPLLIIWLGIGLTSKISLVFLVGVFPVIINTSSGVRNLDPQLLRTARCFGASDLQIFRTVALPGSVPFILSGLRLAVGQSLIGVFVAELLGAQHGIGMLMTNAGDQFQTATVFAGLFIFALAGVLLTSLVRRAERHFDAWRL
ncbi:MAG: ABC transporter permease, partial [Sciscionella sp.]